MRRIARFALTIAFFPVSTNLISAQAVSQRDTSWSAVDAALGRKGAAQPGGVNKYSFPRSDLSVTLGGVTLKPALALGSWVAFKRMSDGQAMAMGDLVLTESEVSPVMEKLQAGGIDQTALHNHLLGESPAVRYMHISARGAEGSIAKTIHEALSLTGTPLAPPTVPPASGIDLDTAAVARALGYPGKVSGGVYQVSVPRADKVTENGMEIPPAMGVATAINFQPTGDGKAAITGDFVLVGSEVELVLRALRSHGIQVTALHSHMIDESPRLFFMHFWANDDATKLATALRAALGMMHVQPAAGTR